MSALAVKVDSYSCQRCNELKPVSSFYKDHTKRLGHDTTCSDCVKEARKIRYETDSDYRESQKRQSKKRNCRKYGLTVEEYDSYFVNASCGICESTDDLVLDHCHKSGRIRGVLCRLCNSGIGKLRDDAALVRNALMWLTDD